MRIVLMLSGGLLIWEALSFYQRRQRRSREMPSGLYWLLREAHQAGKEM
jgi:hypothetical protein